MVTRSSRSRRWRPPPPRQSTAGGRERPELLAPGERPRTSCRRLTLAYVLAVVLPGLTGLALLPLRAEHPQLIAIILVVPVVATALLGAFGPSLVAALCAGLVFGVIHTEPYWRVAVNDPEAIATTATLILVGLVVGWLCSRVARLRVSAEGRAEELRHLLRAASTTSSPSDSASLAAEVCDHLVALLKLRDCRRAPDVHGSDVPILLPSGAIMGRVASLGPDRGELPEHPRGTGELGRRRLRSVHPDGGATTSGLHRRASRRGNDRSPLRRTLGDGLCAPSPIADEGCRRLELRSGRRHPGGGHADSSAGWSRRRIAS